MDRDINDFSFKEIEQPEIIKIEECLRLKKPLIEEWKKALPWYQNPKVLHFSEGVEDKVYDFVMIQRMYTYLSKIGELYFIEIKEGQDWIAIGDVTLAESNMPIALGDEKYWGKGIGKKAIRILLERAKEIGMKKIRVPAIYHYNDRSRNLFEAMGFKKIGENDKEKSYEIEL